MTVRGMFALLVCVIAATATAQEGASARSTSTRDDANATTTFLGDTGLWFVPTAEVLAHGRWSVSAYRRGTNFVQGFSNVSDIAGTAAVGLGGRVELFTSLIADTRIDRDIRPLFTQDPVVGGILERYPRIRSGWSGDNLGDLNIGAKVLLLPQGDSRPFALAVRGLVKAPTGDDEVGVSTGRPDVAVDLVGSSAPLIPVVLSGYVGYERRGRPDDIVIATDVFRWGAGAGFPARGPLRGQFELTGLVPNADAAVLQNSLVATDGSVAPASSEIRSLTRATAGVTWQHARGFFVGGGVSWNVPRRNRDQYATDGSNFGDFVDWQIRIGFHPGARGLTRAPLSRTSAEPAPAVAPAAPAASASAIAPESSPAAPPAPAPSASVPDAPARAGEPSASAAVAQAPTAQGEGARREYTFEDVYFDFDRYSLRAEAGRVLDEVVRAMRDNQALRLDIEGHTCNIGTAEYNLALGDRRANAVRQYLVSHGISAERLHVISYGEERPKFDNAREETRRLNRRGALVASLR